MTTAKHLVPAIIPLLLCAAHAADARPAKFSSSGWGVPSQEADVDGSLSGGTYSTAQGTSNFGKFSAAGMGDLADWDGVSFCDFDDSGAPRGVLLNYLGLTQVVRFENGDMLFSELSASLPSTLCFNFIDNRSYTFEIHSDIAGGTGKFEGATGTASGKGRGENLRQMGAFSSESTGDIVLPKRKGKSDKDD